MEVTSVEIIRREEPIELPKPWVPAWREPDGNPITSFRWSVIRLETDTGVVGFGPATGSPRDVDIVGFEPNRVGEFWSEYISRRRSGNDLGMAGVEIALWDAFGKAVSKPVCELLGAVRTRVPVYAATSRLMEPNSLAEHVMDIREQGFNAAKLRLHRSDPREDLAAVRGVRDAVGDDFTLMVDANQNNASTDYEFWSRRTARRIVQGLDELAVDFIEEPLPRKDVEGLGRLSEHSIAAIAGGEHSKSVYEFKTHIQSGAYDILQPDVMMDGNMGILGVHRTAILADVFDRSVIPHVIGGGNTTLGLAATLQVAGATTGVSMVEFPHDPPVLTPSTLQTLAVDPIWIDNEGYIEIPSEPGLGIEIDTDEIDSNGEIVWKTG